MIYSHITVTDNRPPLQWRLKLLDMLRKVSVLSVVCVLWFALPSAEAADTLPSQYSDAEFWLMVTEFSEPGGSFPYENFVSNEVSYQDILPELTRIAKPGGAYLGVAPEQTLPTLPRSSRRSLSSSIFDAKTCSNS
jgi:hypothetical protein